MERETELIMNRIKELGEYTESNLILDIGCHAGEFVNLCAKHFGNNANMIAFEPDIKNVQTIINNTTHLTNCKIVPKAIFYSDKKESVVYGTGDGNIGGYMVSLIEPTHVNTQMFPQLHQYDSKVFELCSLEEFCDGAWLVKLDCEASEWNIFEHSSVIQNTKHIEVEFHNHTLEYFLEFIAKHLPNHEIVMILANHCYLTRKD